MVKLTLIGEICQDIFIYGTIDRLCPEAPVPIFKPDFETQNLGMAGNVYQNLKSLDPNLDIKMYHQNNTLTKTRLVDKKSNQMIVRIDNGENSKIDKIKLNSELIKTIQESDIVIVSDYDKGFLSLNDLVLIGKNSKLSILDSKKTLNQKVVNSFTFVKLNQKESLNNKKIIKSENLIITLGEKGAKYKDKIFESPSPKETIDVSGAGDTFVASFILKYSQTNDINESINFANQMSSIVVSKRGVSIPDF